MKLSINLFLALSVLMVAGGCVERIITVTSDPAGAVVWLNDEEVGATPVTTHFTWYGDYDVVVRREGYETLHTSRETPTPVWQWPGLDLFFECFWPFELVDEHTWHFDLTLSTPGDPEVLIRSALDLQAETSPETAARPMEGVE